MKRKVCVKFSGGCGPARFCLFVFFFSLKQNFSQAINAIDNSREQVEDHCEGRCEGEGNTLRRDG